MTRSSPGKGIGLFLTEVERLMPPDWALEHLESGGAADVAFRGPDGTRARLEMIRSDHLTPRDARLLGAGDPTRTLVLARYLSPRTREVLIERGYSYADATGNVRIVVARPAIFLRSQGLDQDPDRKERPLRSLRGSAAARVVRGLCELACPLGVRRIAALTEVSLGTASRVVDLLESEAIVERDRSRTVTSVDRKGLLRLWARDYGVQTSNTPHRFIEPRGLAALWPRLERLERYAATGSLAGPGVAPVRLAMIYVDDAQKAADVLGLVATEVGANVILLEPFDPVVYARSRARPLPGQPGAVLNTVSTAQAYVDLATGPGRGPDEAAVLLERLEEAEP